MMEVHTVSAFQLREAAGCFWLVDTAQTGRPYRQPIPLNSAGAAIWRMKAEGLREEEIVRRFAAMRGEPETEIAGEVSGFLRELEQLLRPYEQ